MMYSYTVVGGEPYGATVERVEFSAPSFGAAEEKARELGFTGRNGALWYQGSAGWEPCSGGGDSLMRSPLSPLAQAGIE